MSPAVYVKNGVTKQVKDLGWLLNNDLEVQIDHINVRQWNDGTQYLNVSFKDGVQFESEFASLKVLNDWLKARRSWRGVKVHFVLYGKHQRTWNI